MSGAMGVRVRVGRPTLLQAVRLEDESNSNSKGGGGGYRPLSFPKPKPSWVVRTQSNVRKLVRKKPDPPCVVCHGSGRVPCHHCFGQGRTNHVHLTLLPKGEWPKWCSTCGGSGLTYCSRCLGTGEYRYIMGFHFMHNDSAPQIAPHPFPQPDSSHADQHSA